jgi:hypothetical protein
MVHDNGYRWPFGAACDTRADASKSAAEEQREKGTQQEEQKGFREDGRAEIATRDDEG